MTREEFDFIGSMNMCDEISNEAYKKIVCHCREQEPCEDWYDVPSDEMTLEQARQAVKDLRKKLAELEQEPCQDVISRQVVIDALHTWFRDGFDEDKWWNSTHVLAAIEGAPSVHQKHKWETCFECPLSHGCPKIKGCTNEQAIEYASKIPNDCPLSAQPERKTDEDAISRQAAIRIAERGQVQGYEWQFKELNKLPPVNPQPKTGYISIDDVMSVFDDYMLGEVDEDGTDTFLKMLKDRAESEE